MCKSAEGHILHPAKEAKIHRDHTRWRPGPDENAPLLTSEYVRCEWRGVQQNSDTLIEPEKQTPKTEVRYIEFFCTCVYSTVVKADESAH
jgi:hypothetical protein